MIIEDIQKVESLPSPALGLLPAVHDATVEVFVGTSVVFGTSVGSNNQIVLGTAILPAELPAPESGRVFLITAGAVTLPAYRSWPSQAAPVGSHVASDGRQWFRVVRYKQTNSYYPAVFERTLYTIAFTPTSLPLRQPFILNRVFALRLFANNTNAVCNVVWELGDRRAQATPSPTGPNLERYEWREPMIDEQVPVTDVASLNLFGVYLYKNFDQQGDVVFTGLANRYGRSVAVGANQLPLTENFALRVRIACFDTENPVADPRGFFAYQVTDTGILKP